MKYIKIKNDGIIEPEALHLMGASTKVGDSSKIGQFGSGTKYALAYLLRNNYETFIYAGLNPISVNTQPKNWKDKTFNVIYIDGKETSITTDMGKDWRMWQALREIYCNAIDEGGVIMEFVAEMAPKENETHFYIENKDDALSFTQNFNDYFSQNKEVLFECEFGRILKKTGEKANIYRKGIKCFETNKTSVFDYDFNDILIDENRLVRYFWTVEEKIWQLIYQCDNKDVIIEALRGAKNENSIEGTISEYASIQNKISNQFKEVIDENELMPKSFDIDDNSDDKSIYMPTLLFKNIYSAAGKESFANDYTINEDGTLYKLIPSKNEYDLKINECLEFFDKHNYSIDFPIEIAKFDKSGVLGCAHEGCILLSEKAFDQNINDLCNTIIEEQIHLKTGAKDKTREFQTAIIDELLNYMVTQREIS